MRRLATGLASLKGDAGSAAGPDPSLPGVPIPADIMHMAPFLRAPVAVSMPPVAADVLHSAMFTVFFTLRYCWHGRGDQQRGNHKRKFTHSYLPPKKSLRFQHEACTSGTQSPILSKFCASWGFGKNESFGDSTLQRVTIYRRRADGSTRPLYESRAPSEPFRGRA